MEGRGKVFVEEFATFVDLGETVLEISIARRGHEKGAVEGTGRVLLDQSALEVDVEKGLLGSHQTTLGRFRQIPYRLHSISLQAQQALPVRLTEGIHGDGIALTGSPGVPLDGASRVLLAAFSPGLAQP